MIRTSKYDRNIPFSRLILFSFIFLVSLAGAGHAQGRAKFEPEQGCYIGAFIELDSTFINKDTATKIEEFEALTKKKHASYFTYVGYGQPFPAAWVDQVKKLGAAPHIAFEPNNGLAEVQDDAYLRAWARDAARARCPIFLRWASEMNGPWTNYSGNPPQYREKFRLMYKVMSEEAPNVALVWTPFPQPQRLIDQYYPGDEYVDWVGVNIYSVYVNDGDPRRIAYLQDPLDFIRYIYENYGKRKPVHISEFAATSFCKGTGLETVDFAIEKMTRFYNGLRQQFPRVKAVNWFCLDTVSAGLRNNNYSILHDGRVLATYRRLVADDYFLSEVRYDATNLAARVALGTTLGPAGISIRPAQQPSKAALLSRPAAAVAATAPTAGGVSPALAKSVLGTLRVDMQNGNTPRDKVELRAQLPSGLEPRGLIWQVDGHTVAITNTAPYRVTIAGERLAPGRHTARVLMIDGDESGIRHALPEVEFQVVK